MFSAGFENILHALRGKPHRFPGQWSPEPRRVGAAGGQTLHAWLKEQVHKELQHRGVSTFSTDQEMELLAECTVEPNMGVFASLECVNKSIRKASIQVLISKHKSLADYYGTQTGETCYIRLDYEPGGRLEEIFKTPLPHIHVEPHGEPRIPLESMKTGNLVVDFFDWVYRTYLHPTWRIWAQATFAADMQRRQVLANPWDPIEQAFLQNGKLPILRQQFTKEVGWMKKALRDKKDAVFPLRVDQEDCDLIAYR